MTATAKTHLALVQPKTESVEFVGGVLPYKPPFDKIFALVLLNQKSQTPIEQVRYWIRNDCPPEQFAQWRDEKLYPIDIGDRKYHQALFQGKPVGSASEFVVRHFGLELTDAGQRVLEMVNKNNKTGYLKAYKFAVPHIMRELYELRDDEDFHIDVISNTTAVIDAFTEVENGTIAQSEEGLEEALPDLVAEFAPCQYQPFTLGRYMRDLWLLGNNPADIRDKLTFWTKNWSEVQQRLAAGREAFQKLSLREHDIAGTKAVIISSDDRFLAKAAIKSGKYGIRIIRTGAGHTVISTNGYDLQRVFDSLRGKEPGRWYYQPKMGALINGGPQYVGVEPTAIAPQELLKLLQAKVSPKQKGR